LLRSHLEQRRPAAETAEPRPPHPRHGAPASNSARVRRVSSSSHRRRWSRMRRASRSACSARARARFSACAGSWVVTRHHLPPTHGGWSCRAVSRRDRPIKGDSTGRWSLAESCRIPGHPLMLYTHHPGPRTLPMPPDQPRSAWPLLSPSVVRLGFYSENVADEQLARPRSRRPGRLALQPGRSGPAARR
jgi:hypothetical protein